MDPKKQRNSDETEQQDDGEYWGIKLQRALWGRAAEDPEPEETEATGPLADLFDPKYRKGKFSR